MPGGNVELDDGLCKAVTLKPDSSSRLTTTLPILPDP